MWTDSGVKRIYREEEKRGKEEKRKRKEERGKGRIRRRTNLIPASPSGVPFTIAWIIFRRVIGIIVFINRKV